MAAMEVENISREIIKPSTPTPPHLRTHILSLLDQVNHRSYVPVVYFYPKEASDYLSVEDKSNQLKKSLSETLSKYYPFAGRIGDRFSIDCNDEGVAFVKTRIRNFKLSDILENPKDEDLALLISKDVAWNEDPDVSVIVDVQVSFFDCGGMALGIGMSHKIVDASTIINFVNNWAAVARDSYVPSPEFVAENIFPQADLPLFPEAVTEKSDCVAKRFVFDHTKIAALKALVADKVQNPTRVEVVASFIYSCAISALRLTSGSSSNPTVLTQSVNLRTRMVPPVPQNSVGCMVWIYTVSTAEDSVIELHDLVAQLKQNMTRFCDSYAQKFRGKDQWPVIFQECLQESMVEFSRPNLVMYKCTSWCRFPMYEVDFGWGKPIWITVPSCTTKDCFILLDTKNGEGIEAYVNLEKQQLDVFERDEELLAFASLNPSISDSV
ncbi:acyltransferase Pun1-like [Pyrus x bretschneideri]|uniref:acyltransferase Pun1-like n=1 Tax=Pyrus x bretschneideri TaxID=225117 RepID=UPI00203051FA|nr:acyltransferase Pun1-like [Pyrus x bretschneideri]